MRFQIADVDTYPLRLDTIGKQITAGYSIHASCEACAHHGRLNLVRLAYKIGFDHACLAPDIRPHVKCSRCGEKRMNFVLSPPSQCTDIDERPRTFS